MQLRSKALSALSAAHQLKKEAASLRTLGLKLNVLGGGTGRKWNSTAAAAVVA
jgi:hypothetical protein